MLSFYKRYWRTVFDIALIVLTVLLTMWIFSFVYDIAKPIFYSFVIFMCIEPLARKLNKWGIKKSIASAISVILFTLIILAILGSIILIITLQGSQLIENIPTYQKIFAREVDHWTLQLQTWLDSTPLNINLGNELAAFLDSSASKVSEWSKTSLKWALAQISSITTFFINAGIGIILAYFLSIEIVDWKKFTKKHTPNTFKTAFFFLKENVLKGIWVYVKSQAILISITFVVILLSLLIMGVNHAFVIALIAAIFDILPLLGVSTIFIPWITYLFIVGQVELGIMITILWLVVVLARQFLEPKITGESLGVSAFTMFAFMIISLSLFGIAGLILSPILLILIKALIDQGYLQKWIRKPIGEYDEQHNNTEEKSSTVQEESVEHSTTETKTNE